MSKMRKFSLTLTAALLAAGPAAAASGPFFSLRNTDFVVLLAFLLFLAVLAYFKVPGTIAKMLDQRAEGIRNDLDEARAIREEAQALLASYERKQREVQDQADRIVAHAREEARLSGEQAQADMKNAVERRLASAQEQIDQARRAAEKEVQTRAVAVSVEAARKVVAEKMTKARADELVDASISEVGARLH